MKSVIKVISAIVFFSGRLAGQETSIVGAWQSQDGDDETVLICQAGYIVIAEFNPVNTAFYYSSGGSYTLTKERLIVGLAFTTNRSEAQQPGEKRQLEYSRLGDKLSITKDDSIKVLFTRIDNGNGMLAGVWQLAGKHGALKDLLILSAGRFQRIHFNTQTNELISSYGGRYDYSDEKYIEHINFYRKDPDKIGKSVSFTVEIHQNRMTIKRKNEKGETVEEEWMR